MALIALAEAVLVCLSTAVSSLVDFSAEVSVLSESEGGIGSIPHTICASMISALSNFERTIRVKLRRLEG